MSDAASNQVVSMTKKFRLPAAPERVFAALTDPAALKTWFSEHAVVELREGGAYRFWGRFTPWVDTERDADQRITRCESPRVLAFTWTWRGAPGTVTIELAVATPSVTHVTVRHTSTKSLWPIGDEAEWVLFDFWWSAMANLHAYLKAGKPALRADFSAKARDVDLSIEIDAPPERVWQALTNPAQLDRWLTTGAVIDPRAGGVFDFGWSPDTGTATCVCGPSKLLELVPGEHLTHDWHNRDEGPSQVTWSLAPLPGGRTRVTLRHVFTDPRDALRDGYIGGWSRFLAALRDLLQDDGVVLGSR